MESLEFFFAEPGIGRVSTRWGSARDVAGQERGENAILDFVPLLQREVDLDGSLLLASVRDVESGDECAIPAELIYYPAPDVGQSLFGSSTNGLASGNSLLEASIQALLELIERDIWSFEFVRCASKLVQAARLVRQHMLGVSDPLQQTLLTDIPDLAVEGTLQQKLDAVIKRLRRVLQEPIYRVVLTPPELPLQVVRLVVPLLENLKENRV